MNETWLRRSFLRDQGSPARLPDGVAGRDVDGSYLEFIGIADEAVICLDGGHGEALLPRAVDAVAKQKAEDQDRDHQPADAYSETAT